VRKVGSREKGLPPGPPTVPILGNAHRIPALQVCCTSHDQILVECWHCRFTEWARKYGDLCSLKIGNDTVVVLTDVAAVKELLDRRSSTTADRPPCYIWQSLAFNCSQLFIVELITLSAPAWKTQRRAAAANLTPQATSKHLPIQRAEATQLLHDILHSPQVCIII
ncbi:cytochrome P450, partial [Mycena albidolilacea]